MGPSKYPMGATMLTCNKCDVLHLATTKSARLIPILNFNHRNKCNILHLATTKSALLIQIWIFSRQNKCSVLHLATTKSALLIPIWNFSRQNNVNAWDSLTINSRLWEPQAPNCDRCWPNPGNKLQEVLGRCLGFFQPRCNPPQRVRRIMWQLLLAPGRALLAAPAKALWFPVIVTTRHRSKI